MGNSLLRSIHENDEWTLVNRNVFTLTYVLFIGRYDVVQSFFGSVLLLISLI